MFPECEWGHRRVVLCDSFVYADVFKLSEAVFLVHLYDCNGACELVGAPEVFYEKVCDGDGFGSSGDANAPLPGL